MMNLEIIPLGDLAANCYVCYDEGAGEAVVIDPGTDAYRVIDFLEKKSVVPKAILLTHSHYDHIGAVKEIRQKYNAQVAVHEDEQELLADGMKNLSGAYGRPSITMDADVLLKDGESFAPFSDGAGFQVLHTPGHTKGGASFYFEPMNAVFTGDTLFRRSIGRYDLYSGDYDTIIRSIKTKLMPLPEDTTVYPGHGAKSTIKEERTENNFLL